MAARLLFSLLLILLVGSHGAFASVQETCAKAMKGSEHKNLESFCVTTLQAAPGSASADAKGLAAALATCRRRYIEALNVVHSAVHALATGRKQAYVAEMGAVRRSAIDCDDAFGGRGGDAAAKPGEAPLRKVNDDAENLTTMAMLIVITL
uniref:Pectinesterase inhibitor domain-containing protein n=1 Tax=Aegilops tauschii TaxID=37682 RepID=M8ARR6_AEGTA